jgi:branched-chain amino acid transport system permease protein
MNKSYIILAVVLNGVSFAMLLFLLAAGLELMFGVMNIINLAHGSFYMIGAYVGMYFVQVTGNFVVGILAGMATGGLIGLITDRVFFSRITDHLQQVILTFGIVYIIADLCKFIWGGNPMGIAVPAVLAGSINIGGIVFPVYRSVIMILGFAIALALWFFQEKTLMGAIIRAGVDDKEMVSGFGININLINTSVFCFGGLLAGFAGVIGSPILFVYPRMSWEIFVLSLMVVVVGGMGSLRGAFVGSLIIGLTDSLGKFIIPSAATVITFSVMVLFLIVKPLGLFGSAKLVKY